MTPPRYGRRLHWGKHLSVWTDWRSFIITLAISKTRWLRIELRTR